MNAKETMNTQPITTSVDDRSVAVVAGIKVRTKFQPTESQRVIGSDAFSYYSNKFNLEKARQFKQDDAQVIQTSVTSGMSFPQGQGPVTKRRKGSKAPPLVQVQDGDGGVRQTRISYEAHLSLIIDDEIIRMLEQMDCADISDDEDDEESSEEMSDDAANTSTNEEKRSGEEQQQPVATMVSHCQMIKSQPTSQETLSSFPFHGKQAFGDRAFLTKPVQDDQESDRLNLKNEFQYASTYQQRSFKWGERRPQDDFVDICDDDILSLWKSSHA